MPEFIDGIQPIATEQTYALRHRILRPEQTLADCAYPLDNAPKSYHAGYYLHGELVGVGSVFQEAQDGTVRANEWRIRGMAVAREAQGKGFGGEVLQALLRYAAAQGNGDIWCNGRAPALSFYKRFGFTQVGAVFDVPPIGPHFLLRRSLTEADR